MLTVASSCLYKLDDYFTQNNSLDTVFIDLYLNTKEKFRNLNRNLLELGVHEKNIRHKQLLTTPGTGAKLQYRQNKTLVCCCLSCCSCSSVLMMACHQRRCKRG